jgi:hypothetical protein
MSAGERCGQIAVEERGQRQLAKAPRRQPGERDAHLHAGNIPIDMV